MAIMEALLEGLPGDVEHDYAHAHPPGDHGVVSVIGCRPGPPSVAPRIPNSATCAVSNIVSRQDEVATPDGPTSGSMPEIRQVAFEGTANRTISVRSDLFAVMRWLHGMRPAAKACEEHYATRFTKEGYFWKGISAATVFGKRGGRELGARGRLHGVGSGAALAGI